MSKGEGDKREQAGPVGLEEVVPEKSTLRQRDIERMKRRGQGRASGSQKVVGPPLSESPASCQLYAHCLACLFLHTTVRYS